MRAVAVILFVLAAALAAVALFHRGSAPAQGQVALTVYCAAGLKQPVEAIAEQYRRETGIEVRLQYGNTGSMLSAIRVAQQGDLYIAADDGALEDARQFGVIREAVPLVRQVPTIAVRRGNPKNILSLADLQRDDVRLALADPQAAAVSRTARKALGAAAWERLQESAVVMKPTVTEIAADLSLGAVDAALLWDATVPQFKRIEAVEIPEFSSNPENASAAVLAACAQPAVALRFARYLSAPEKGGLIFQQHGFKAARGDRWAAKPDLVLYSGGVNRIAIEKLLRQFAAREGITVTTVFNGCGILCATMKTMDEDSTKVPDAYYACDLCFVPPVADQFPEAVMLTETDIGIAIRKGNPRNVRTLADLAQPNLRVGLCNAEQSTLGYMTRGILRSSGLNDSVRRNVVVEVPTADFLINQMRAGGLDAAIVYRVNAQLQAEHLEFIPIQHAGAKAIQPFAVRHNSPNRLLAGRLLDHLKANRGEFEQSGFIWRGDEAAIRSADIVVPEWLKEK